MRHLELQRVFHVGKSWGEIPLYTETQRVKEIHATVPLILSEFRHEDGGEYIMLTNNSQKESTHASLVVRGNRPDLSRVDWGGEVRPMVDGDASYATRGEDWMSVRPWLAPGQMVLYRVQSGAG